MAFVLAAGLLGAAAGGAIGWGAAGLTGAGIGLAAGGLAGLGLGAAAWYAARPWYWYPYPYPAYAGYPAYPTYYYPAYYYPRRVFYTWA